MNNKKIFYGIIAIAVLMAGGIVWLLLNRPVAPPQPTNNETGLSKEAIIEIARQELERRELPVEEMAAAADRENTKWQEYVNRTPLILEYETVKNMELEEKDYWVVYFGPKVSRPGWDAWVFVDANTGEIIGVILGE